MSAAPPTSTLSDLLARVGVVLSQAADATPVLVGKGYLDRGIGQGPRIVFVPAPKGTWGPPTKVGAGYLASVTTECTMLVRGEESGDDATRFAAAEKLAARAINVVRHLGAGRVAGGDFADDSPVPFDAHGADVALSFSYTWSVADDPAIRRAITQALTPAPTLDPMRPNGDTGQDFTLDVSAEGTR